MEKPRILIIDDDPGLRKTLADILRVKGYESLAAEDGAEGVAILARNHTDVVLIDLGLPDITGIELLERVKADHPATEAIILTGNATLDTAIEATNRGAFAYLLKPYDVDQLVLQVGRAMEKQQARAEIASRGDELERFNAELKTLYGISSAISQTLDMEKLLTDILSTLAGTDIFPFEMRGSLFLVENGMLGRAAFIGPEESGAQPCRTVRPGECLCGLALETGEIIVSKNCQEDPRHNIPNPCVPPYGRLIVPLKAADKVVGVLSIYTETGLDICERVLRLLSTMGSQMGTAIDNARLYEETKASALHDPLTGLANRRFMESQLEKTFEVAKRYGEGLSAIMLDIDHFKSYNDTHGHAEGDRLLASLGEILMRSTRSADYVFRYGGEEFFILLPSTNLPEACLVAERLRKTVEMETACTVSLGATSFSGSMEKKEELITSADAALYQAKRNGRNRVEKSE